MKTATGLDIDVLTPDQEGAYGYVAGTRNAPERLSLDPGSNSFQIGWWPKGATAARTVSVPLGYVRGAAKHYPEATAPDTYEVARAKHAAELITMLDQALGKLTPPTSLAALKADITGGQPEAGDLHRRPGRGAAPGGAGQPARRRRASGSTARRPTTIAWRWRSRPPTPCSATSPRC